MLIPARTYVAAVCGHPQWGKTKNGNKQVLLTFEILEGEHAGQTVPWFGYLTAKTWERTLEALRYCGWCGDDLTDVGPLPNKVSIDVEHNTHDGKTHARVAWVNRFGKGAGGITLADQLSADELRLFSAQMRSRAAQVAEVAGEPARSGEDHRWNSDSGGEHPARAGGDIPF